MRAHARRYTVTESGTRHELPDGGLSDDRVRELLKLASNQTCGFVRVSYVSEQKLRQSCDRSDRHFIFW